VESNNFLKRKSQCKLLLRNCELSMAKSGDFVSILIRNITSVVAIEDEVTCCLENAKPFKFRSSAASEWVKWIQWCISCTQSDLAIEMLSYLDLMSGNEDVSQNTPIFAFKEVNGFVWSLDTKVNLMEWTLNRDSTGLQREKMWVLKCQRRISLAANLSAYFQPTSRFLLASPSFHKTGKVEMWCVTTSCAAIVSIGEQYEDIQFEDVLSNQKELKHEITYTAAVTVLNDDIMEVWMAERSGNVFIWDIPSRSCVGKLDISSVLLEGQFITCMTEISENVSLFFPLLLM